MELVLGRADSDDCDLAVTKKTSTNIRLGKVWVETEEYNVGAGFARDLALLAVRVPLSVVDVVLLGPLRIATSLVIVVVITALVPVLSRIVTLQMHVSKRPPLST